MIRRSERPTRATRGPSRPLRAAALALLVLFAPIALDGCVSVGLSRSALDVPAGRTTGELRVSIFERPADRDAERLVPYPVFCELLRAEGDGRPVVRSMAPTWTLPDVPPGRYVLRVTKRLNELGDVEPLSNPAEKKIEIRPAESTAANVVLKKVPVFWIVLGALTVVALIVLSIDLAREGKIPTPDELPHPSFAGVVALSLDLAEGAVAAPGRPPTVVDVFPAKGSVVAARRVTVNFFVGTPLGGRSLPADTVLALGSRSGEIPGAVSYRPEEGLVRFTPARDFEPGERVTVTLDLARLVSEDGARGEGRVSTSFRVE